MFRHLKLTYYAILDRYIWHMICLYYLSIKYKIFIKYIKIMCNYTNKDYYIFRCTLHSYTLHGRSGSSIRTKKWTSVLSGLPDKDSSRIIIYRFGACVLVHFFMLLLLTNSAFLPFVSSFFLYFYVLSYVQFFFIICVSSQIMRYIWIISWAGWVLCLIE